MARDSDFETVEEAENNMRRRNRRTAILSVYEDHAGEFHDALRAIVDANENEPEGVDMIEKACIMQRNVNEAIDKARELLDEFDAEVKKVEDSHVETE